MGDVIVLGVIATVVVAIVWSMRKSHKQGKCCGCSGNCAGCRGSQCNIMKEEK